MHGAKTRRLKTASAKIAASAKVQAAALVAPLVLLSTSVSYADAAPNHVRDVKVREADGIPGGTEIEVLGTGTPTYAVRVAEGGRRVLIDLSNADVAGAPAAITEPKGVVGGVLTQAFKTAAGQVTRLAVSLAKDATYRVRADGTVLRVTFTPAAKGTTEGTEAPKGPSTLTTAATGAASSATAATGLSTLKDVRFEHVPGPGKGKDRVIVSSTSLPTYGVTTTPEGNLRLTLRGTKVPEGLSRTLDVTAYKGSLSKVTTFYDAGGNAAVIEIERTSDTPGHVTVDGGDLVWSFEPENARLTGKARDGGAARRTMTVARETEVPDVPKVETSIHGSQRAEEADGDGTVTVETKEGAAAGFTSQVRAQAYGSSGRYNGRRIDLDLKDADIHNILRLLADVGKVNIVTADDVSGAVTIRMRNVPWDQALDVVLQAKSLGMVRSGNLIRVAQATTLQKERELKLAAAKQEYELTPLETRLIPVSYATADELQARAKELLSPRGSIAVDERTNVLIARDISANLNHIEELVRSLDTQTPQVLVEARIVEATSRYIRDIGIQWGGDATFSEATGNPTGVAFPSRATLSGGASDGQTPTAGLSPFQRTVANPNFAVNLPAAVGTGQGGAIGLSFGSVDNNFNLGVRLSAAEATGMVRIVSSPRILTLDNRTARINQGTLIPFSQVSAQGVQTTFQEAKLQLLVTPHVTADGSVSMRVKINRDEPDFNQTSARGDPTILKREAETDLLVMDGRTAVIGGIYTRNTGRNLDQVPFFGDIPILGILFQRRRASDIRNELVIFITPRIVNRAEALGR